MENKNIFKTWKQQLQWTPFEMSANVSSANVQDDLVTIRKSMDRNTYLRIIGLVANIALCITFTYMCLHGGFTYSRLFTVIGLVVMLFFTMRGWWRSYRLANAEVYQNTKEYLSLSAETIRKYMKNLRVGFYGFYVFLILGNIALFSGGGTIHDAKVFLFVSVVCGIGWFRNYKKMEEKTAVYGEMADKIENMVQDLTVKN